MKRHKSSYDDRGGGWFAIICIVLGLLCGVLGGVSADGPPYGDHVTTR